MRRRQLKSGQVMGRILGGAAMASIYKRGRIRWIHYLVGGKSVSKSLKTTSERVARDRKKKFEAMEVTDQLPQPSSTPIEPFLQSFCEFLITTRTRKSAKNDFSYHANQLQSWH